MLFPPVNLFSRPIQEQYEHLLMQQSNERMKQSYKQFKDCEQNLLNLAQQLKDLNFIYYTRTGRFLD